MPDCNKNCLFYQYYGMACTFEVNAVKYSMPLTFTYFFISILQKKKKMVLKFFHLNFWQTWIRRLFVRSVSLFVLFMFFDFSLFVLFVLFMFLAADNSKCQWAALFLSFLKKKKKLLKGQIWLKGQKLKQNRAFTPLTE